MAEDETIDKIAALIEEIEQEGREFELEFSKPDKVLDLDESGDSNPVKRLAYLLLSEAVRNNATDIYFEIFRDNAPIRYRIDGILYDRDSIPKCMSDSLGDELECMFNKLEEKKVRIPRSLKKKTETKRLLEYGDSAQIKAMSKIAEEDVILTLSKLSSDFGDQYRVKIFHEKYQNSDFDDPESDIRFGLLKEGGGLVIIAGLPGNGKTTIAHNLLYMKNRPDNVLLALGGETTPTGVHHIDTNLRYADPKEVSKVIDQFNPDMVYLDDISRLEVAEIAIDQAYRGKTVIGSLNATDSLRALEYLANTGVNQKKLTQVFKGAIAQRFVRMIHEGCKYETKEDSWVDYTNWKGKGCPKCNNIGYKGRVTARQIIASEDDVGDIQKNLSQATKIKSLYAVVEGLVKKGITTADELQKVPK